MSEKKMGPVEASIARLRELRYMTRGPGAKPARQAKAPTIEQLRADVAAVPPTKTKAQKKAAKKAKKKRGRR